MESIALIVAKDGAEGTVAVSQAVLLTLSRHGIERRCIALFTADVNRRDALYNAAVELHCWHVLSSQPDKWV